MIAVVVVGFVASGAASAPASAALRKWMVSPTAVIGSDNFLRSVACPTPVDCFSVGYFYDGATYRALVERYDGTTWSTMSTPTIGHDALNSVACFSTTSCIAVGYFLTSGVPQTLVEAWDGTTWSVVPSPNQGAAGNVLVGLSCSNAMSCTAVGDADDGASALIESWNGSVWSVASTPQPSPPESSALTGVSCPTATRCFAVGFLGASDAGHLLVERWNGSEWAIQAPQDPGGSDNSFFAVSCSSGTQCAAVGVSTAGGGALIEMWDGSHWTIAVRPHVAGIDEYAGVACPSRTRCVAVGYDSSTRRAKRARNLVAVWDGTSWSYVPSVTPLGTNEYLQGVGCTSGRRCIAVGVSYPADASEGAFALTGRA